VSQANGGTVPGVPAAAGRKEPKAEMGGRREQTHGLGSGYDQIAAEAGRRYRLRPGQAGRLAGGQTSEQGVAQPGAHGAAGFELVIGVDDDRRAWVRVANALLECIASGAVRAGSRVPPVTSLGLERPLAPVAVGRAFRALAGEGVLCWVPGLGYHVRTRFTVAVSDRPRQDGRLTAVLPGGQQAGRGMPASSGSGTR
jgi:DNA-binding transcriptional regulator YhcF (GntR family)